MVASKQVSQIGDLLIRQRRRSSRLYIVYNTKKEVHSHAKKTSIKVGQQVDPICVWLSKDGKEETLYDKHFRVSISLSLYIAALSMVLGTTFVAWKNQLRQVDCFSLNSLFKLNNFS